MLRRVGLLLDLIRFNHTLFALPFALTSAALAWRVRWGEGSFSPPYFALELIGILLCMIFARSAAMAFNRLVDRKLDAANPRTAMRHLPAGVISPLSVSLFALACAGAFIGSTAIFILTADNYWPLYLSIPILAFVAGYSYAKRFTALSHFWLGASLLLAPVGAWIAVRGMTDLTTPIVLGLAVLSWVAGFDILYACQDVDFDRKTRLHSVPARLGVRAALRVAFACHVVMVALLVGLYWAAAPVLGVVYLAGVAIVTVLLAYEHWLVRPDDLSRVNQAFFQVNGIISVGLFLVVLLQLAVPI
jgi:4-hydroxybenzoate polyprenyltransferase